MVLPASRSRESMTRVPVSLQRGQRMQLPRAGYTSSGTDAQATTTYGPPSGCEEPRAGAVCSSRLTPTNEVRLHSCAHTVTLPPLAQTCRLQVTDDHDRAGRDGWRGHGRLFGG